MILMKISALRRMLRTKLGQFKEGRKVAARAEFVCDKLLKADLPHNRWWKLLPGWDDVARKTVPRKIICQPNNLTQRTARVELDQTQSMWTLLKVCSEKYLKSCI